MPIETLWAVLGLAVPAGLMMAYSTMVQSRRISAWTGFATLSIIVLMVVIVILEVFGD